MLDQHDLSREENAVLNKHSFASNPIGAEMNTTESQAVNLIDGQIAEASDVLTLEVVKELSSIELAYVGGGTASVMFY
jgi:hypothetical protein